LVLSNWYETGAYVLPDVCGAGPDLWLVAAALAPLTLVPHDAHVALHRDTLSGTVLFSMVSVCAKARHAAWFGLDLYRDAKKADHEAYKIYGI
jgi:hypothetical protein